VPVAQAGDGQEERERWNAKFLAGEAQFREPNPLVVEACLGVIPGRILDLGGGAGRHSIWLALRGWRAVLTDISDEGLALARQRAADAEVDLTMRRESAEETIAWARAGERFDLIVIVQVLLREHFAGLPELLAPGGTLVYSTYTLDHARFAEGKSTRYALRPGELRGAFPELKTVLYREENGEAELIARAG
jgi:2-polyprenyl-3-methyl-5-hydroxy-6-metoxy-1,4-benzoquinol methylase